MSFVPPICIYFVIIQLTGLVTSFYITLSKNFTDHFFMEQLKEIGYLAHFECLSNSTGVLQFYNQMSCGK